MDDTSIDGILSIVNQNHLIEELDISCNKFTASGVVQVIQALDTRNFKILNINANFQNHSSSDKIEELAGTLAKCSALQELHISNNLLSFHNVLKIVQALRGHPTLQRLDISNNIKTYILECEFLIDVILSVNQSLTDVNISGRNIRPRVIENLFISSLDCDENSNRFVLQNLYFAQYVLTNDIKTASCPHTDYIKVEEECPIDDKNKFSYYVDHNGGTFYNQVHGFAIAVPPGAVSQGECVEIQTAASRFYPDKDQNGYYPISSYFWFSAHYTFKISVYLIMSHYAAIRNLEDINSLCLLRACVDDPTNTKGKSKMKEVPNGVYFDYEIGYCIFATDHFCSLCLQKKIEKIPEKFTAMLYQYDIDSNHFVEWCFCPAINDCREVCNYNIATYVRR